MNIDKVTEEEFKIAEHVLKELLKIAKKKALYESLLRYK